MNVKECECNHKDALGEINIIEDEWVQIKINIDSGAIDSVCGEDTGAHFGIKETRMSKDRRSYLSASKHLIFNLGERTVKGLNDLGTPAGMTFQVCDKIKGPLGSVRRICEAGNRLVFESDHGYIETNRQVKGLH